MLRMVRSCHNFFCGVIAQRVSGTRARTPRRRGRRLWACGVAASRNSHSLCAAAGIVALLCSVIVAASGVAARAEPAILKLSFFGPSTEVNYDRLIKPWVAAVNADPAGAVRIETFPEGALGKALPAQPQMVLDGVVDIAFVNPSLAPGRFPDDQVLELPGLFRSLDDAVKVYQSLISADALRGYGDYIVFGSMMNPNYHLFGRKPMRSLGDLRGMKVRIVGPMIGQTVKELGMVPILMPPTEIVEALGRGTIDAATAVPAGVIDFGIDRVATNDYLVPLGYGPLALLMNRKKFESLPAPAQDVLRRYGIDYVNALYLKNLGAYNAELVMRFKADSRRTVTAPSAADTEILAKRFEQITAAWIARSGHNAELLAKTQSILASLRK
jgi:TRAP-type C4-dicarboxylate transport system substrate-binding protein